MAERLWDLVSNDVLQALGDNPGYELILTGHSLGAGSSLLLNIVLHQDERLRTTPFRTFAFASPPVYSPLSNLPTTTLETAVNYIHDMDDVPFLSGDAVRHEVAALTAIDKDCKDLDLVDRAKLILGKSRPSETLVTRAKNAWVAPLPPEEGRPVLVAPVMAVAWSCKRQNSADFDLKLCDPELLASSGIYIDPESVVAHYPTRYEQAFTNIKL